MTTTLATRVRLRVFDCIDAPTFLVKHQVVQHTDDRQLWILFDRVVFQVFVAAIAIDKVSPIGIASSNALTERQSHGGCLDIKRLVVFDCCDRVAIIDGRDRNVNRF